MNFRRATPDDARAIAEVEVASWRAAYRDLMPEGYLAALSVEAKTPVWAADIAKHGDTGRKRVWVAEVDGEVKGFSLAGIPSGSETGTGLLYLLYFLPEAWGQGFAGPLMERVMDDFRDQGVREAQLWVLEQNYRARRFYGRLGWAADGARTEDDYGGISLPGLRYAIEV